MNNYFKFLSFSLMLACSFQSFALDPEAAKVLANSNGCVSCHSINEQIVGPTYQAVAAKYRGKKNAEADLIAKVKNGGSGVWGPIPMPANSPRVKDEDIKTIVEWVLSIK